MDTEQFIQLAYRRYKRDDLATAIDFYSQVIKLSPDNFFALYHRGECFYYLRNLDSAIADFTAGIHLQPEYAETYEKRGIAYSEQHKLDLAQQDFEQATLLNPARFLELGRLSWKSKDIYSALSFFNTGIRLLEIWLGLDRDWKQLIGKTNKAHQAHWLAINLFWRRAELREINNDLAGAIHDYQLFYDNGGWMDDDGPESILERIKKLKTQIS